MSSPVFPGSPRRVLYGRIANVAAALWRRECCFAAFRGERGDGTIAGAGPKFSCQGSSARNGMRVIREELERFFSSIPKIERGSKSGSPFYTDLRLAPDTKDRSGGGFWHPAEEAGGRWLNPPQSEPFAPFIPPLPLPFFLFPLDQMSLGRKEANHFAAKKEESRGGMGKTSTEGTRDQRRKGCWLGSFGTKRTRFYTGQHGLFLSIRHRKYWLKLLEIQREFSRRNLPKGTRTQKGPA